LEKEEDDEACFDLLLLLLDLLLVFDLDVATGSSSRSSSSNFSSAKGIASFLVGRSFDLRAGTSRCARRKEEINDNNISVPHGERILSSSTAHLLLLLLVVVFVGRFWPVAGFGWV